MKKSPSVFSKNYHGFVLNVGLASGFREEEPFLQNRSGWNSRLNVPDTANTNRYKTLKKWNI